MGKMNIKSKIKVSDGYDSAYYFFVDKVNEKFPGFSKIIDKVKDVFDNVKTINSLEEVKDNHKIIPFGIVASNLYLKRFRKGEITFLMDSTTLCFASMMRFYIQRKLFFNKFLIGASLRYVKYYFVEKRVIRSFDKVIVVSEHDASYLENKFNCSNIEVITNGADFPDLTKKQSKTFNFTLGILSYWGAGNYNDVNWFFTDYLPELKKIYPGLKIITAGRGADDFTLNLFKQHNIEHLGEIDDLWDFFNGIDIYITTLRKECGILNKVLDAMAHQKIVVGLEHNMYAFKSLKNGYFTYKNLNELIDVIEFIKTNPELVESKINHSYNFILENHNWIKNYQKMKNSIDRYYLENSINRE
tara:strand:- start:118228 stop:119301 length:1074 start_codon:yes stop_codon:yes gene_type:complete